jgi:hypothetical protein
LKVLIESMPVEIACGELKFAGPGLLCPRGANTVNPWWALESVGASWSRLCAEATLAPKAVNPQSNTSWKNDLALRKTVTASFQITWMRRDLQTCLRQI